MSEPRQIAELIRYRAEHTPDHLHARYLHPDREPDEQTYADLERRVRQLAAALIERGAKPGSVVHVIINHHKDMLPAFYAVMWIGAMPCYLPFPTGRMHPERYFADLRELIEHARPSCLITYGTLYEQLKPALENMPHSPPVLLHELVADDAPLAGEPAPCDDEDIVVVQCSSGSTGLKKGVSISNRAIFNHCEGLAGRFDMTAEDCFISWLPLYHDWGLVCHALLPLVLGASTTLMSPVQWVGRPAAILEAITEHKGTIYGQPNFAFNFMTQRVKDKDLEGVDLSSLRFTLNGGEICWYDSHDLFAKRFACVGFKPEMLGIIYGMAEVVCVVFGAGNNQPIQVDIVDRKRMQSEHLAVPVPEDHPEAIRLLCVGRTFKGTTFKIVDEDRNELPDRHVGEVMIKTWALFHGYHLLEEATRKKLDGEWYITEDLGYAVDGVLWVTGRKTDLIIIGGENIYPHDIEYMVGDHPDVVAGRVVAIGVDDHELGTQRLVIIAESRSDDPKVHAEIRRWTRREVAGRLNIPTDKMYIAPHKWLFKTSSGKPSRAANLARVGELNDRTVEVTDT